MHSRRVPQVVTRSIFGEGILLKPQVPSPVPPVWGSRYTKGVWGKRVCSAASSQPPPGAKLRPPPEIGLCLKESKISRRLKAWCFSYFSCSDPSLSLRHSSIPTCRMGSPASGDVCSPVPRVLPPARCARFRIRSVGGCPGRPQWTPRVPQVVMRSIFGEGILFKPQVFWGTFFWGIRY